eukprot:2391500-Rhodomonas_salina.1
MKTGGRQTLPTPQHDCKVVVRPFQHAPLKTRNYCFSRLCPWPQGWYTTRVPGSGKVQKMRLKGKRAIDSERLSPV